GLHGAGGAEGTGGEGDARGRDRATGARVHPQDAPALLPVPGPRLGRRAVASHARRVRLKRGPLTLNPLPQPGGEEGGRRRRIWLKRCPDCARDGLETLPDRLGIVGVPPNQPPLEACQRVKRRSWRSALAKRLRHASLTRASLAGPRETPRARVKHFQGYLTHLGQGLAGVGQESRSSSRLLLSSVPRSTHSDIGLRETEKSLSHDLTVGEHPLHLAVGKKANLVEEHFDAIR